MKNILILYLSFRFVKDRNWTQKSSKLIVQNFSIGDPAAIASAMIFVPIAVILIAGGLLVGTNLSPLFTKAAIQAQFNMPSGANQISSICDGSNPLSWLIVKLMSNGFGITMLIAIFFLFLYLYKKHEKTLEIIAGASKEYLEKSE